MLFFPEKKNAKHFERISTSVYAKVWKVNNIACSSDNQRYCFTVYVLFTKICLYSKRVSVLGKVFVFPKSLCFRDEKSTSY
jgi:hypothetical protein